MTIINLMQAYELDKLSKLNLSDEEILRALRSGMCQLGKNKCQTMNLARQWLYIRKGNNSS
ncbi:Uncharacterised protein [Lysinibacillus capsici]|uniref:Uncharacterized protein n=1 Tax=Lysinibacillus capsici TaxID=2115968 RepID=A0A2X1A123_9BACI|nr:Uncharacterised protein [Lysinibacillus capsici]